MWPEVINWGSANQQVFWLCLVLAIITFLFVTWYKGKRELKNSILFDNAFFNIFAAVVSARLIGMLGNLADYSPLNWSWLPIKIDDFGAIDLTLTNPWSFFNFVDGNFFLPAMIFGLTISVFIVYANSDQKKNVFVLLEKTVWAFVWANLFLLTGLFIGGYFNGALDVGGFTLRYIDGGNRFPLQLAAFVLNIIIIIVLIIIGKIKSTANKRVLVVASFFVLYGAGEFLLRFYADGYTPEILSNLDFFQALELVIVAIGLLLIVGSSRLLIEKDGLEPIKLGDRKNRTDIRNDPKFIRRNNFAMSFSDRQSDFANTLPLKERLFGQGGNRKRTTKPEN